MPNVGELNYQLGGPRQYGVMYGLVVRNPNSATLTATIEGGYARVPSQTLGQKFQEFGLQESTKAFTASKDTYVFLNSAGTIVYIEVANGAAKPTQAVVDATNGVGSIYLAKVVTDGTRVLATGGVLDLRTEATHGELEAITVDASFEAGETGAFYVPLTYNGRVLAMFSGVYKALAGTDTGTEQLAIGENDVFVNATNGLVTHAISAAIGTRNTAYPTALNAFRSGNQLRVTTAKTTSGGKASIVLVVEKLPK